MAEEGMGAGETKRRKKDRYDQGRVKRERNGQLEGRERERERTDCSNQERVDQATHRGLSWGSARGGRRCMRGRKRETASRTSQPASRREGHGRGAKAGAQEEAERTKI